MRSKLLLFFYLFFICNVFSTIYALYLFLRWWTLEFGNWSQNCTSLNISEKWVRFVIIVKVIWSILLFVQTIWKFIIHPKLWNTELIFCQCSCLVSTQTTCRSKIFKNVKIFTNNVSLCQFSQSKRKNHSNLKIQYSRNASSHITNSNHDSNNNSKTCKITAKKSKYTDP